MESCCETMSEAVLVKIRLMQNIDSEIYGKSVNPVTHTLMKFVAATSKDKSI